MAQRWLHRIVHNSSVSNFKVLYPDGTPMLTKHTFLEEMKYIELTYLLVGSMLYWSVVFDVML
jgi:hypothetical protein